MVRVEKVIINGGRPMFFGDVFPSIRTAHRWCADLECVYGAFDYARGDREVIAAI